MFESLLCQKKSQKKKQKEGREIRSLDVFTPNVYTNYIFCHIWLPSEFQSFWFINLCDMVQTFLEPVLRFKLACKTQFSVFREHSFFRRGGGPEESRVGSLTFCPKREGQHEFGTTKRWVTINFTASRARVILFNKKYRGRAGRFYIQAHKDSSGPPPSPF